FLDGREEPVSTDLAQIQRQRLRDGSGPAGLLVGHAATVRPHAVSAPADYPALGAKCTLSFPRTLPVSLTRRSRKSEISAASSSSCVAVAKWPVFKRCSSASGRSRRYARAPSGGKNWSFFPHGSRAGGRLTRRYSCQRGYSMTLLR